MPLATTRLWKPSLSTWRLPSRPRSSTSRWLCPLPARTERSTIWSVPTPRSTQTRGRRPPSATFPGTPWSGRRRPLRPSWRPSHPALSRASWPLWWTWRQGKLSKGNTSLTVLCDNSPSNLDSPRSDPRVHLPMHHGAYPLDSGRSGASSRMPAGPSTTSSWRGDGWRTLACRGWLGLSIRPMRASAWPPSSLRTRSVAGPLWCV
mmetsp:Transcript_93417/g.247996  ORF Transcript_93417/g.247996 Transcript_93417/m.247996 type:complete len:205 (-) Transcript_93417:232-846(-)